MPKPPKQKRTFVINPDVFIKLKIYAAQHAMPYSIILEALADTFVSDPTRFSEINFDKYK